MLMMYHSFNKFSKNLESSTFTICNLVRKEKSIISISKIYIKKYVNTLETKFVNEN